MYQVEREFLQMCMVFEYVMKITNARRLSEFVDRDDNIQLISRLL